MAVLAVSALALLSCGRTEVPDRSDRADQNDSAPGAHPEEPRRGGTVVLAAGTDIAGINQLTGTGTRFNQDVLDMLFLRLFDEQPDYQEHPPTFAPELAASHRFSDDRTVLTVELTRGVTWSDGVEITSADVVWTHEAQISPEIAWSYADIKERIASVTALDAHTIQYRFHEAYASALADVNEGVILPRHRWAELPFSEWRGNESWFVDNAAYSGPFVLAARRPQEEIVLERNPRYFRDGRPLLDRVVFRVIPNRANQIEHLLSGQVDFVEHVAPSRAADVERSERARIDAYLHRQYNYIVWNGCREPFRDARVRRALTLAIDRHSMVEALWGDRARLAFSPILSSLWAVHPQLEPWPYDPETAAELLTEAGWADSDGDGILDRKGRDLRFELSTNSGNQVRADAAVMIKTDLARIGVDVRLRQLEFNTLIQSNEAHDFDATIGAWSIDTSLDLKYAFHSDSIENGHNYGCYVNAELDELIDDAKTQVDIVDAVPLLHRAQEILHQEQPYTFLWEPTRLNGVSRSLRGAQPNPLSAYFRIEDWWLADPS